MASYWYEHDPVRLVVERQAMQSRYPRFVMRKLRDGKLAWHGTLISNSGTAYEIAVIYPDNFPNSPPNVFPVEPVLEVVDVDGQRYKHQYSDGHLCLYYPSDRTFGTAATAATVVAVAAVWFWCYEYWLQSGKQVWPGKEAD